MAKLYGIRSGLHWVLTSQVVFFIVAAAAAAMLEDIQ